LCLIGVCAVAPNNAVNGLDVVVMVSLPK
jgi:hypothetical protein